MKKHYFLLPIFILSIACSNKHEIPDESVSVTQDSVASVQKEPIKNDDSDCVFDNDPEQLTKQWLNEAGFKTFAWDKAKERAIVIIGNDTLFAYKGGCSHLTSLLELHTENLENNLFDNKQMQKIDDLACRFKFDNYCHKIANGQYDKMETERDSYMMEFETEGSPENLVSEGIEVIDKKGRIYYIISEYYN